MRHHELSDCSPWTESVTNFTLIRCRFSGSRLSITMAMVVLTNNVFSQLMFTRSAFSVICAPPTTAVSTPDVKVVLWPD